MNWIDRLKNNISAAFSAKGERSTIGDRIASSFSRVLESRGSSSPRERERVSQLTRSQRFEEAINPRVRSANRKANSDRLRQERLEKQAERYDSRAQKNREKEEASRERAQGTLARSEERLSSASEKRLSRSLDEISRFGRVLSDEERKESEAKKRSSTAFDRALKEIERDGRVLSDAERKAKKDQQRLERKLDRRIEEIEKYGRTLSDEEKTRITKGERSFNKFLSDFKELGRENEKEKEERLRAENRRKLEEQLPKVVFDKEEEVDLEDIDNIELLYPSSDTWAIYWARRSELRLSGIMHETVELKAIKEDALRKEKFHRSQLVRGVE